MSDGSNYQIDYKEVLKLTNNGLQIILDYYPDARDCVDKKKSHFKKRTDEKTASTTLRQVESNGVWIVTDFGDDQKSKNAIEVVREEEGLGFYEALKFIVDKYNLQIEGAPQSDLFKPKYSERPATKGEREGQVDFKIRRDGLFEDGARPKFTDYGLKEVLGPHVTAEICEEFNLYPLESYTRIKNRKAMTFESTDRYPIFMIDEGEFQKIYQPLSADKAYRFSYAGIRPKDYVFGLDFVRKCYEAGKENWDPEANDGKEFKLPRIILCMGDRDALNVRSLSKENYVIWLNSESQTINGKLFAELMLMTDNLYQVPDLDATGRKHGVRQALKFLDLKTVWLPLELTMVKDWRGNKCKDVTDFVRKENGRASKEFEELLKVAPTARFWDEIPKQSKDGKYTHISYEFNNVHAYYFLNLLGVYRFRNKNEKMGYIYIKIDDHIVREIEPVDIKGFVNDFLEQRRKQSRLRNMVYKTPQLSEGSLSNLAMTEIDFTDFDKDHQYLFFSNVTWKVTGREIVEVKSKEGDRYVWEDEVIDKRAKKLTDFFTIEKPSDDSLEELDIRIENKDCLFFRYLIQTSRVHWRKELEDAFKGDLDSEAAKSYAEKYKFCIDGPNLSEDEIYEQKMHLINKIYALGYLLHRYKDPDKPWCVVGMDNNISDEGESHGGTGKSICFNAVKHFMKYVDLNGRDKKLFDNPHVFEKINIHTDYVLIDDADQYLNFGFLYKPLTGDLEVNPKGVKQYSIPFADSPKFCLTTNFVVRGADHQSTRRRILYAVFSDYYHYDDGDGTYNQDRSPQDDFGKNLFNDFTDDEWNYFYNFMAQCIKFYISHNIKINPPMANVRRRNLKSQFGDSFGNWAEVYFNPLRLNTLLTKSEVFKDYQSSTNMHKESPHRFTKRMKAWCKYHDYILDPESLINDKTRIVGKDEEGKTVQKMYIRTVGQAEENVEQSKNPF